MPAAPPQSSAHTTAVWIPHGAALFYGIWFLGLLLIWLWSTYFKSLDHNQFCWMCGGDKEKNLCFMGAHHFKKDDDGNYHDHLAG